MVKATSIAIVAVLLAGTILPGCGEDDSIVSSRDQLDGVTLLGLVNNRTLTYLQTDTVVTIDSTYSISVTTSSEVIRLSAAGGNWTIKDGDVPLLSLKVTSESVIQNGYWRKVNGHDSLIYFPAPPVVMTRSPSRHPAWQGFVPFFDTDAGSEARFFFYSYFGFYFSKEYRGTADLIVPAGAFTTHRFDVDLFVSQSDTLPAVQISEYYAPSVGLVQLQLRGGPLKRTLSLVGYN